MKALILAAAVSAMAFAASAAAQGGDPGPHIGDAADAINLIAPQSVDEQTIGLGMIDGAAGAIRWDVATGYPPNTPDNKKEEAIPPGPVKMCGVPVIESFNCTYVFQIVNKPADFSIALSTADESGQRVQVPFAINPAGTNASITFHPFSGESQTILIHYGGRDSTRFLFPRLKEQVGAFVIPHQLIGIIYAPPGSLSTASYLAGVRSTTVVSTGVARSTRLVMMEDMELTTRKLAVSGAQLWATASGFEALGTAIEKVDEAVGDHHLRPMSEIGTTDTTANGTSITLENEHQISSQYGDQYLILQDVLFVYYVVSNKVHLVPTGYRGVEVMTSKEMMERLPAETAASFLALNPAVGGPGKGSKHAPVDASGQTVFVAKAEPRFTYVTTAKCKPTATDAIGLRRELSNATIRLEQITQGTIDRPTGWVKSLSGYSERTRTVTISNSTEQVQTGIEMATMKLTCAPEELGPGEYGFYVDIYLDELFGTFLGVRAGPIIEENVVAGSISSPGGQPLRNGQVSLRVGKRNYLILTDEKGRFGFDSPGPLKGTATLTVGKASLEIALDGKDARKLALHVDAANLALASGGQAGKGPRPAKDDGKFPVIAKSSTRTAVEGTGLPGANGGKAGQGDDRDLAATADRLRPLLDQIAIVEQLLAEVNAPGGALTAPGCDAAEAMEQIRDLLERLSQLDSQISCATMALNKITGDGDKPSGPGIADDKPLELAPCCDITANPELKGRLGRVVVKFPEGSKTGDRTLLYKAGETKAELTHGDGGMTTDAMPGQYAVVINGLRIEGVEVRAGHDTNVHVGVLRILSASGTARLHLYEPGGKNALSHTDGPYDFGLLPGKYEVELLGQREVVTIKSGVITEF